MRPIAEGTVGGVLAVAQRNPLLGFHRERHRREGCALVGTITSRAGSLIARMSTNSRYPVRAPRRWVVWTGWSAGSWDLLLGITMEIIRRAPRRSFLGAAVEPRRPHAPGSPNLAWEPVVAN